MAIKNISLPDGNNYELGAKGSNVTLDNYIRSSGDVATGDDVVTAIGKVDGNSAENRAALVEVVDEGAKNLWDFKNATPASSNHIAVTKTDVDVMVRSTGAMSIISYPITLPAGNYVLSIVISDYRRDPGTLYTFPTKFKVASQANGSDVLKSVTITGDRSYTLSFESTGDTIYILYCPNDSGNTSYKNQFKVSSNMVCTKAAWDISHVYQPYRPNVLDSKMTRKQAISNGMHLVERSPKAVTNPNTGDPYIYVSFADYKYDFDSVAGITTTQFGIIYCNDGTARVDDLRLENVDGIHIIKKDNSSGTNLRVSGTNPVTAVGFVQYQDSDGAMSDVLYTKNIGGDYRMLKAPDNIELLQALFSTCFVVSPPYHVMNGSVHGVHVSYGFKENMNPITKLNIDFTVSEFGLIYSRDGTVSAFRKLTLDNVDDTHVLKVVGANGQNIVDNGYGVLCVGYVVITLGNGTTFTVYTNEDIGGKASELPTTVSSPALSPTQLTSIVHDGISHGAASIPMGAVDNTSTATVFTATVSGITSLFDGVCMYLKNGVVTSAEGCTLNINGLGAKPIYRSNTAETAVKAQFNINHTVLFVYNSTRVSGGCWDYIYGYNDTYSLPQLGCGFTTCSTAADTAAKVASLTNYNIQTGGLVAVKFTNAVPANATLNINSKGAKNIRFRGSNITAGVIKAGDIVLFTYSSQYHVISIDRWGVDIADLQARVTALGG